ncbi:MAG: hypothetical protein IT372_36005 [Polyangiaceae bacterium]|nr:hypothetical protein [Polyangiaceae bacterium]
MAILPRPALARGAHQAAAAHLRGVLALAALVALAAAGCGRSMTEDDCRKVGENMRQAWEAEAKKAAPIEGTGAEKAAGVVKSEQEKLLSEWLSECKKELQGRRVDAKEMDCLLAAKTLDEITRCSER